MRSRGTPVPEDRASGKSTVRKRDDIGADRPASQQGPRLLHEVGNDGVIDVQEGEIFPTGGRDSSIARSGDPGVPLVKNLNAIIAPRERIGHLTRTVNRSVIDDDGLPIVGRLLRKRANGCL